MNPWLVVGAKYHDSESLVKYYNYFNSVGPNRCPVFVDMKEIIAKRIYPRQKLTLLQTANVLGLKDHASALFLINGGESEDYGRQKSPDYNKTMKYVDIWINEGVYPISRPMKKNDVEYLHFRTNFKLIKI